MEKFHLSKIVKLDGQECGECSTKLETAAVKCDQCKELFHLKCTKMPTHTMIKYFTTRVSYACKKCVIKTTDGYEDIENLVIELGTGSTLTSDDVTVHNKVTTEPAVGDSFGMFNKLAENINELRAEVNSLAQKMNPENKYGKQKLYSQALRSTEDIGQSSQQAVYIKRKDCENINSSEADISSALKAVPAVSMRNVHEKTIKLVFPNGEAKQRAVEEIEQSESLNNIYEVSSAKKLRPKITVTYIPDFIDDSEIIKSVTDKSPEITELIENPEDLKLLFTKPSAHGFKTAVISTSPLIRNAVMKTGFIYMHMSRCKVYDRYWVFRCNKCMQYGHKAEKCRQEKPRCGYCAGEHYTKDCTDKNTLKCCHCTDNTREEKQHSAFDTSCPSFIAAKNRIIRRTMYMPEKSCSPTKNGNRLEAQTTTT